MWCSHTMDYYSAIKRDKVLIHAKTWRNVENMMIHVQRPTYCINPFMCMLAAQSCLTLRPHGHSPPGSSVCGILQARTQECVAIPLSRESSRSRDPGIKPRSLALQADSLPSELTGKSNSIYINKQIHTDR